MKAPGCVVGFERLFFALVLLISGAAELRAHPGSGIVVDGEGRIYFTDTGQGIWKIDERGQVSAHEGPAYHWMTIDHRSRFAEGRWPEFVEPSTKIERVGKNPTLLIASDFSLTTGVDGALYYPEFREGVLRIYKLDPSGAGSERKVFATIQSGADGKKIEWCNGMAARPDGSIYFTENAAVRRITREGEVSTIAQNMVVENCRRVEGTREELGPLLRGLDVARDGSIYVAANACRALLKISPEGVVTTVLRNEPPWSPTGVAVSGDVIYVLEYLHTEGDNRREWVPRVRRIAADGSSKIIAQIERSGAKESRAVEVRPGASSGRSETLRGTKAGDEIEIRGVKFCWCPASKFKMGSPASEAWHRPDEEQVEVTLTKGFWMGKYEVTQGEWKRVMGTTHGDLTRELNAGVGETFPVYWVSYKDAEEFCRKLTAEARAAGALPEGWTVRLPTEAQWEYACRAGTTTAYSFGDTLSERQANVGKPYNGTPTGVPGSAASAVGSYPANAWGLHDMHGNEFEWCRDWYHARLPGGTDPFQREVGSPNRDGSSSRVRRGGAWTDKPEFCRSAVRIRFEPHRSSDHIGFRVAITQD